MKRDVDLIRDILLRMEARDQPEGEFDFGERSDAQVHYHLGLLCHSGLITAEEFAPGHGPVEYVPLEITWAGHEFLDNIRNETVWAETKDVVSRQLGTVSVAILQEVAKEIARTLTGLP